MGPFEYRSVSAHFGHVDVTISRDECDPVRNSRNRLLRSMPCDLLHAAILVKNSKRDVYHQIPILKAFLWALGWTPVAGICFLLMVGFMGG